MTGQAACEALLWGLPGVVSTVHQPGQITNVSAGKIAYITNVESDSAFALQLFQVTSLELFQESGAISQHRVEHSRFKREGEQEQGQEANGQFAVLILRLVIGRNAAQFEDIPKDREEQRPDKITGTLDLLAA